MHKFDEAIAVLKGQIDAHNGKLNIIEKTIEQNQKEIARLENQKANFNTRNAALQIAIDNLLVEKAKNA